MPEFDIHINTADPPSLTQPADWLAIGGVPTVQLFFAVAVVYTYICYHHNSYIAKHHVIATSLMCFGGAVHVLSVFISNGHLNSYAWFRSIQNMHCPLWDFWGKFVLGFSVWFYGLLLHNLHWIHVLRDVGDHIDADSRDNAVDTAYNPVEARTRRGTDFAFAQSTNRRETSLLALAGRHRYIVASVTFGAVLFIAVCAELLHATSYNPEHETCYTRLYMKAIVVLWIFCSMALLIWMLVLLRRTTRRNAFMRICSGLKESQHLLVVCTCVLVLLLLLNMSNLLIYSIPRTIDTMTLAGMYVYSVITMHFIAHKMNDSGDRIEHAVKTITFGDVWGLHELRAALLRYVENSSERDLRFVSGFDQLARPLWMSEWSTIKTTFYGKVFHPDTQMNTALTIDDAIQSASAVTNSAFCIEDEEEGEEMIDLSDTQPNAAHTSFDRCETVYDEYEGGVEHNIIDRRLLVQFIRDVANVIHFANHCALKQKPQVLQRASRVVLAYFAANLSDVQKGTFGITSTASSDAESSDAEDACSETCEPQLSPHTEWEQTPDSDCSERPQAPAMEMTERDISAVESAKLQGLHTLAIEQRINAIQNSSGSHVLTRNEFEQSMPRRQRLAHVLPMHIDDLYRVYTVLLSGNVSETRCVLEFLQFVRSVAVRLIEHHYYRRALANSSLLQRYEQILREQVLEKAVLGEV